VIEKWYREPEYGETTMKRFTIALLLLFATSTLFAKDKQVAVKVVDRQDSEVAYEYLAGVAGGRIIAETMNLSGATLTLLLPDGNEVVVNCASKFKERFSGPGNVRSCRVPLVDQFEATFQGGKAKLFWTTSLDGKKIESETYKIVAVLKSISK
jgi:hypothetical protein